MTSEEDREARLRTWAGTALTYYGPEEGWTDGPEWGMRGGTVTGDGVSVELEGSVTYRGPSGSWIEVVSHRPADDQFVELKNRAGINLLTAARRSDIEPDRFGLASVDREIRWLEEAWAAAPPDWVAVLVAVAGRPTVFGYARLGPLWTAVGRARDADLVLTGRGDTLPASLIPIPGPGPLHLHRLSIRTPRARRFPDQLTAPVVMVDIPEQATVDLVYRPGELSGTYASATVRLALDVPTSRSSATGSFTGTDLSASWDLADNSTSYPDVTGTLKGTFGGQPVSLAGTFHLDDDWCIDHAAVDGAIAGQKITARLEAVDGGFDCSGRTVSIEGDFAGTVFGLYTAISGDMTKGIIRGHVAGEAIQLDTSPTTGALTGSVRIVGRYTGPPALLAIIVCTFLYFV